MQTFTLEAITTFSLTADSHKLYSRQKISGYHDDMTVKCLGSNKIPNSPRPLTHLSHSPSLSVFLPLLTAGRSQLRQRHRNTGFAGPWDDSLIAQPSGKNCLHSKPASFCLWLPLQTALAVQWLQALFITLCLQYKLDLCILPPLNHMYPLECLLPFCGGCPGQQVSTQASCSSDRACSSNFNGARNTPPEAESMNQRPCSL